MKLFVMLLCLTFSLAALTIQAYAQVGDKSPDSDSPQESDPFDAEPKKLPMSKQAGKSECIPLLSTAQLFKLSLSVVADSDRSADRTSGKLWRLCKCVQIDGYPSGGNRKVADEFVSRVGVFRTLATWHDGAIPDGSYMGDEITVDAILYWEDPALISSDRKSQPDVARVKEKYDRLRPGRFVIEVLKVSDIEESSAR